MRTARECAGYDLGYPPHAWIAFLPTREEFWADMSCWSARLGAESAIARTTPAATDQTKPWILTTLSPTIILRCTCRREARKAAVNSTKTCSTHTRVARRLQVQLSLLRALLSPGVRQFGYAPSTRPKKTIADATPVKTHTGSKPLPNGRSRLNPSANIATETRPLNITGQFIGTSQLYWRPASTLRSADSPAHSPPDRCAVLFPAISLIARIQPLQPSNEMRRQNCFRRLARSTTVAERPLPNWLGDAVGANQPPTPLRRKLSPSAYCHAEARHCTRPGGQGR